jgi:hypothetical protein
MEVSLQTGTGVFEALAHISRQSSQGAMVTQTLYA